MIPRLSHTSIHFPNYLVTFFFSITFSRHCYCFLLYILNTSISYFFVFLIFLLSMIRIYYSCIVINSSVVVIMFPVYINNTDIDNDVPFSTIFFTISSFISALLTSKHLWYCYSKTLTVETIFYQSSFNTIVI